MNDSFSPFVPVEQQKDGLRFVLKRVGKKQMIKSLGGMVYLGMMSPRESNHIFALIEEIENEG